MYGLRIFLPSGPMLDALRFRVFSAVAAEVCFAFAPELLDERCDFCGFDESAAS